MKVTPLTKAVLIFRAAFFIGKNKNAYLPYMIKSLLYVLVGLWTQTQTPVSMEIERTVVLIRHAKSSWDNPDLADFDRPLNERGHTDAPFMATQLALQGLSQLDFA